MSSDCDTCGRPTLVDCHCCGRCAEKANRPLPDHSPTCTAWHHQGGDYDRDCPGCMVLAAREQGKPS